MTPVFKYWESYHMMTIRLKGKQWMEATERHISAWYKNIFCNRTGQEEMKFFDGFWALYHCRSSSEGRDPVEMVPV